MRRGILSSILKNCVGKIAHKSVRNDICIKLKLNRFSCLSLKVKVLLTWKWNGGGLIGSGQLGHDQPTCAAKLNRGLFYAACDCAVAGLGLQRTDFKNTWAYPVNHETT